MVKLYLGENDVSINTMPALLPNLDTYELESQSHDANGESVYVFSTDRLGDVKKRITVSTSPVKDIYNTKMLKGTQNKLANITGTKVTVSLQIAGATYDAGAQGNVPYSDAEDIACVPMWGSLSLTIPAHCKQITDETVITMLQMMRGVTSQFFKSGGEVSTIADTKSIPFEMLVNNNIDNQCFPKNV